MKIKQIGVVLAVLIIGVLLGKTVFNTEKTTVTNSGNNDSKEKWTCSMHPAIVLPEFGDCPICGMDLIKSTTNDNDGVSENAFKMTKNAMALANIETFTVGSIAKGSQVNSTVLSGQIKRNEKKTSVQIAPFGGRIESIYIKSTGEYVKAGELIACIYSPELVSVQNELIEALEIKEEQPEMYKAIKNKIRLWEVSEAQIQEIENTKKVIKTFNLYADVTGYVTDIYKEEGNYIVEGTTLFKVVDLDNVWAEFDVYENNIKSVNLGQEVSIIPNAYPNMKIESRIDYIDPILNTETRTVVVRVTIPNENHILKPGMFVNAVAYTDMVNTPNKQIIIPKSAVLWTGKRSIVYVKVKKNQPVFEMRKVELQADLGAYYLIASGLDVGEVVVSNGAFTVDAAAQLRGKNSMMSALNDEIELSK